MARMMKDGNNKKKRISIINNKITSDKKGVVNAH
jgi:hypothetical protein